MDFLVEIQVRLPDHLGEARRTALLAAELEHGRELRLAGVIQHIWRVPGARRNIGIWRTPDAGALHEAIASLPLFEWMAVDVTPLAPHPADQGDAVA